MLHFSPDSQIFLFGGYVDLRNGFEGLTMFAQEAFGRLQVNAHYVFLNRRRTKAKVLHWNGKTLSLWYTHTQSGVFSPRHLKKSTLTQQDFFSVINSNPPSRLFCYKTPI